MYLTYRLGNPQENIHISTFKRALVSLKANSLKGFIGHSTTLATLAALYATKLNGELIQEIAVSGSQNFDWEALGIDSQNRLWIGEIGNNSRLRQDLKVVVVEEPNPFTETAVAVIASYPYRYPNENVDAEGLFIVEGIPYIVSKERERAVLYRFPALQPDMKQVLARVGGIC